MAIDLGSANTRLFAAGRGLLAETPSVISGAHHPLRRGIVVDIGGATSLLEPLIRRVRRLSTRPRALACIPSDATPDQRKALLEATRAAGARQVAILPEPLAAAIGADLDIASGYAQMLVDLGDGVTDVAIVRNGEIVKNASLHSGCSDLRGALLRHLESERGLQLGDAAGDRIVRQVCAFPRNRTHYGVWLRREDQTPPVDSQDVLAVIEPLLERIVTFVDEFVRALPNSIAVEVIESGACVTGGGAKFVPLVDLLRKRSGLTITVARDPLHAVIRGAGKVITGHGAKLLWNDD